MKVTGLDGREHVWSFRGCHVGREDSVERSGPHLRARQLLRELFPVDTILEEVPLPGSGGLRADFYLPLRRMITEVHGQQHAQYVAHYHGSRLGWIRQQQRDEAKLRWAELNNLALVTLWWNESSEVWRRRLSGG